MINKAVIMAGGKGSRMQMPFRWLCLDRATKKLADKGLKQLIPLDEKGRCILDLTLERLLKIGYNQICLVISPKHREFKNYCARKGIEFAVEEEPLGTAAAVYAARDFVGEDSFIVLNSDNLYSENALMLLHAPLGNHWYCIGYERDSLLKQSNMSSARIKQFGVLVSNGDGLLAKIVEKPQNPDDYLFNGRLMIHMNALRFNPKIFEACEKIKPSERGELELTSAIQYGIDNGTEARILYVHDGVLDVTSKEDILTAREFLKNLK